MTLPLRRKHQITVRNVRTTARDVELAPSEGMPVSSIRTGGGAIRTAAWWALAGLVFAVYNGSLASNVAAGSQGVAAAGDWHLLGSATGWTSRQHRAQTALLGPQPVKTTSTSTVGNITTSRLSWRTPQQLRGRSRPESPRPATVRPASHVDKPTRRTTELNAPQIKRDDPFADPFHDRLAQQDDLPALPDLGTSPDDDLDLPDLDADTDSPDFSDLVPGAKQPDLSPPGDLPPLEPAPGQSLFREPEPLAQEGAQPTEKTPCDRVYNGRNCCEKEANCKESVTRLNENPIRLISLDITPSFAPDVTDPERIRADQQAKLTKVAARVWQDRDGHVVAEGKFKTYRNGKIHVEREDGSVTEIAFQELSDDDLCFVTAWWGLPSECQLGDEEFQIRDWALSTLTWKASGLCHKPLYFEEVQLERYGHSAGPIAQPILSGAHFFASVVALPYKMGINPPHECRYALGYYRVGNCAPYLVPPIPLSLRGALAETGAVLGLVYTVP